MLSRQTDIGGGSAPPDGHGRKRQIPAPQPVATTPGAAPRHRVLVVDDHEFVRVGIIALLHHERDLECCGEAETVAETRRLLLELAPELLILDLSLRDGDSFGLIEQLQAAGSKVPILVVSHHADLRHVQRALRGGVRGYVCKDDAAHCLIHAIRAVLSGKSFLSPSLATLPGGFINAASGLRKHM